MDPVQVDVRVTPSLHPQNLQAIDGYGEATAPYVIAAVHAFETAYRGLTAIHNAKEAVAHDPSLTEASKLLKVAELADRKQVEATRAFDSAMSNLSKGIAEMETTLSAPLVASANNVLASEIRSMVRSMSTTERQQLLDDLRQSGDRSTMAAILGAPAFLSGLSKEMADAQTRLWHETQSPDVAKKLRVMKAARELLEMRGPLIWGETEKAIGAPPSKIQSLRKAVGKAAQAFAKA